MRLKVSNKIKNYREIAIVARRLRQSGKKIVFAMGSFDLLHFGHVLFLEQAKKIGDILIVGIGTDKTIKTIKGKNRPIYPEKLRVAMVATIEFVDYAVILKESIKNKKDDYSKLLSKIKPHIFVLNYDDSTKKETEAIISKMGIKLKLIKRDTSKIPFISTTATLKKIERLF